MKRIIRFALPLLLATTGGLYANAIPSHTSDTASSIKSITLHGSLAVFNAAYGRNYFELNWNTIAGDFDHFEIERSLDGQTFEKLGNVKSGDLTEAVEDQAHSLAASGFAQVLLDPGRAPQRSNIGVSHEQLTEMRRKWAARLGAAGCA